MQQGREPQAEPHHAEIAEVRRIRLSCGVGVQQRGDASQELASFLGHIQGQNTSEENGFEHLTDCERSEHTPTRASGSSLPRNKQSQSCRTRDSVNILLQILEFLFIDLAGLLRDDIPAGYRACSIRIRHRFRYLPSKSQMHDSRVENQHIHLHPVLTKVRIPGFLARISLTLRPTRRRSKSEENTH